MCAVLKPLTPPPTSLPPCSCTFDQRPSIGAILHCHLRIIALCPCSCPSHHPNILQPTPFHRRPPCSPSMEGDQCRDGPRSPPPSSPRSPQSPSIDGDASSSLPSRSRLARDLRPRVFIPPPANPTLLNPWRPSRCPLPLHATTAGPPIVNQGLSTMGDSGADAPPRCPAARGFLLPHRLLQLRPHRHPTRLCCHTVHQVLHHMVRESTHTPLISTLSASPRLFPPNR
jgi:hypothetical protein